LSVSAPAFKKRKAKQRRREREEKKIGRRKEKEASNTGECQTNTDNEGLKKKASPVDQVSCLLFLAFACILNSLVTVQDERRQHFLCFFVL
jgi:hypothetical protein